ncbi:MAG: hypothetical protein IJ634_04855 [Bacteroidales bacterium]|nr:hypothetical protein [Bacteroidales bacterium]
MTTFDEQWDLLEGQHMAHSMVRQFPAWQRRRRLQRRVVAAVLAAVLIVAAVVPLLRPSAPLSGDYTLVCCNRTQTFSDQQWADLAAILLDDNNNSLMI